MPRPLVVYFKDAMYFDHARRVYIAARTKKEASEISGKPVGHFAGEWCKQFPAGHPQCPAFIQDSGAWLEIRDHDREGHLENDTFYFGAGKDKKYRAPTDEAAFVKGPTLEACKEAFTLKLDRALAAAGVPREDL